ncbi:TonB-dependent receptor [bacterium]|nr:TonB-dependent receptor [bacterium]
MLRTILVCFLISVVSAFGQDSTDTDSIAFEFLGVTITATRVPEPIFEVPLAVSVLSAKQLQIGRGYGLNDALAFVPGVLAQSRYGNQDVRISIRGFGVRGAGDRSNAGTSRGIRVLVDGIPETEPDGRTSFDLVDPDLSETMEIVRSNSSAIWGNAGGGVLSLSTVPSLDQSFIALQGKAGSFGLMENSIKVGSVVNNTKFYMALSHTQFDGWRVNSNSDRWLFNFGAVSQIAPTTKLGLHLTAANNLFNIPGPLTQAQFDSAAKQANPTYLSRNERRHNKLGRIGFTVDHDFDDHHGVSAMSYLNPKYLQRSERGTFRDFTRYHFGGNVMYKYNRKWNDRVKGITLIGADEAYQDGAILFYSLTNGQRGDVLADNKREGANNFGAFFQQEISVNEQWAFIAGFRYDNVTYYSENFVDHSLGLQKKSFTGLTPKAGITYLFSPKHSIYANLGGGVEVPAGNETDPAGTFGQDTVYAINPLLDPIRSTTVEVGTKHLIPFDDDLMKALSYDIALYAIEVRNDIIPYRGGRFYFTAGKTRRIGAELGGQLDLQNGLSLKNALTYSHNEFVKYVVDSAHYGNAGHFADYGDNKVPGLPDYYFTTAVRYTPQFFSSVYVEGVLQGTGKFFVDDANTYSVPSFTVVNVSIGSSEAMKLGEHMLVRWSAGINNLADKKYAGSAFINPDLVGGRPVYLEPGLPRNYVLSLSVLWK